MCIYDVNEAEYFNMIRLVLIHRCRGDEEEEEEGRAILAHSK